MNLETKITIYKFTPQVFTLTRNNGSPTMNEEKTGEVLTSPKKDMYIIHGWEGKNKNM